jgi:NitT/TauT family transport system substrate-binding protein
MRRISKPAAASLAAIALAGLVAACGGASDTGKSSSGAKSSGGSGASATSITVGYQPDLHGAAPMLIAQQQGYFKQAGLNVKLVRFPTGPPLFAALQAGKLDFGLRGAGCHPDGHQGRRRDHHRRQPQPRRRGDSQPEHEDGKGPEGPDGRRV